MTTMSTITTSVQCPVCDAPIGADCKGRGMSGEMTHHERKNLYIKCRKATKKESKVRTIQLDDNELAVLFRHLSKLTISGCNSDIECEFLYKAYRKVRDAVKAMDKEDGNPSIARRIHPD